METRLQLGPRISLHFLTTAQKVLKVLLQHHFHIGTFLGKVVAAILQHKQHFNISNTKI